jgi:hypothetical protein
MDNIFGTVTIESSYTVEDFEAYARVLTFVAMMDGNFNPAAHRPDKQQLQAYLAMKRELQLAAVKGGN